jgi:hypothetical protein
MVADAGATTAFVGSPEGAPGVFREVASDAEVVHTV